MGAIVNAANCTLVPAAAGAFVVTKTGGADGALDASAVSAAAMAGDFLLRVRPLVAGLCYAGVSGNPGASLDATSIERGVQLNGTLWRVSEAGSLRPGAFPIATCVWIRRGGGQLQYMSGPDLATAAVRRSVADLGGPLFFDSAFAAAGAAIEVKFDTPAGFATRRPRRLLTISLGF